MFFPEQRGVWLCIAFAIAFLAPCAAQQRSLPLSNLNAGPGAALYTTYAAPLSRSEYWVDEGYHLDYDGTSGSVMYTTDHSGDFDIAWALGKQEATTFYRRPVIHRSYTDIAQLEYWPFDGIEVRETFVVYSSRLSVVEDVVTNHTHSSQRVRYGVHYHNTEPVTDVSWHDRQYAIFRHVQDAKTWSEVPHPEFDPDRRDLLMVSEAGETSVGNDGRLRIVHEWTLAPGETRTLRIVRGVQQGRDDLDVLLAGARQLLTLPLDPLIRDSEQQYAAIPRIAFKDPDQELAYWSAFNLVRQQMMPAEGESHFNYYLFSREPTWSWGHDGQVFHESLSMLAYAYMDPRSAEDSQRVYMARQGDDGYIGYRVGPYANRTFPTNGEATTSAPFFAWENWEIYRVSHDRSFLQEAYRSSSALANYILRTRDKDHDGFLVWGGNAMLENVRDSADVIWHLLGGADDSPSKVKALDLMCMMVKEERSLAAMARELGKRDEAERWTKEADRTAKLVRTRMWDEQTGYFYNLARDSGTFTTKDGISLKRPEIIAFLPLWAGIATKEQAARLVKNLTDPNTFWRRFGVPTLSADDTFYEPNITRCCQWNGAVWFLWDYLVFRGLLDYGYREQAAEIAQRNMDAAIYQLKNNHRFWESYSADNTQLNSPKNYIWDCILPRMMIDLNTSSHRAIGSSSRQRLRRAPDRPDR